LLHSPFNQVDETRCHRKAKSFWKRCGYTVSSSLGQDGGCNIQISLDITGITPPHLGLQNQQATCYLNAVIQMHFMNVRFREELTLVSNMIRTLPVAGVDPVTLEGRRVIHALAGLFNQLGGQNKAPDTLNLTGALGFKGRASARLGGVAVTWTSFDQHDATEFLTHVLYPKLEAGCKGTTDESGITSSLEKDNIINSMFGGAQTFMTTCSNCKYAVGNQVAFRMLIVPVCKDDGTGHTGLLNAVKALLETEQLNGYDCSKCNGKCGGYRQLVLDKLPPCLTFTISRQMIVAKQVQKIHSKFTFPLQFCANQLCIGVEAITYHLSAIIIHCGEAAGGHYMAILRCPRTSCWYTFNDVVVSKVPDLGKLMEEAFGGRNTTSSAYLLQYQADVRLPAAITCVANAEEAAPLGSMCGVGPLRVGGLPTAGSAVPARNSSDRLPPQQDDLDDGTVAGSDDDRGSREEELTEVSLTLKDPSAGSTVRFQDPPLQVPLSQPVLEKGARNRRAVMIQDPPLQVPLSQPVLEKGARNRRAVTGANRKKKKTVSQCDMFAKEFQLCNKTVEHLGFNCPSSHFPIVLSQNYDMSCLDGISPSSTAELLTCVQRDHPNATDKSLVMLSDGAVSVQSVRSRQG
jgi:hypothetical protein